MVCIALLCLKQRGGDVISNNNLLLQSTPRTMLIWNSSRRLACPNRKPRVHETRLSRSCTREVVSLMCGKERQKLQSHRQGEP